MIPLLSQTSKPRRHCVIGALKPVNRFDGLPGGKILPQKHLLPATATPLPAEKSTDIDSPEWSPAAGVAGSRAKSLASSRQRSRPNVDNRKHKGHLGLNAMALREVLLMVVKSGG